VHKQASSGIIAASNAGISTKCNCVLVACSSSTYGFDALVFIMISPSSWMLYLEISLSLRVLYGDPVAFGDIASSESAGENAT
jgi:hypothetical protein